MKAGESAGDMTPGREFWTGRWAWAGLAIVLLAIACATNATTGGGIDGVVEEPRNEGLAVDRIVYVDDGGDIFTINGDGTGQLRLTGAGTADLGRAAGLLSRPTERDNLYTWPTWSPDGTKIAASHVGVAGGQAVVTVEVIDAATGQSRTVFTNDIPALVAQGAPHYLYWSPDSTALGILAGGQDGLDLWVVDVEGGSAPVRVTTGAPLYFHWSSGGEMIAIHVGGELLVARRPYDVPMPVLASDLIGFRVPALSPDRQLLAYVESREGEDSLRLARSRDGSEARAVADVGRSAAFAWSPAGGELAVVDGREAGVSGFERLRVVASDGDSVRDVAEGAIVCFYWSPSGDKLAWLDLDDSGERARWWVETGAGSEPVQLFSFRPSPDTGIMLWFFDQYGYSHSPWSPDGTRLVFAGRESTAAGSVNGHGPRGDRVFVLDVESGAVKEVAAGKLAFWSWN